MYKDMEILTSQPPYTHHKLLRVAVTHINSMWGTPHTPQYNKLHGGHRKHSRRPLSRSDLRVGWGEFEDSHKTPTRGNKIFFRCVRTSPKNVKNTT
jgi:hypothetical protein